MQLINDISVRHASAMGLDIRQVTDSTTIETVSSLASEIWSDHYKPIIGTEQVEYMLKHFQNPTAIQNQIAAGYQYYLLWDNAQPLAYFAWLPDTANKSLHISKLYVRKPHQCSGLGSHIIAFTVCYCEEHALQQIWLTVNRHNRTAINFYLRNGFSNAGAILQNIGAGFVMDDFRMIKNVNGQ